MATEVKKVKFVYFDYVHPKAFHLTSYKQNLRSLLTRSQLLF